MALKLIVVVLFLVVFVPFSQQKPSRSRNSDITYDQKQTGEYNIQLHLKDFEIVALVSDSAFGDLGDYEYNYDYSDILQSTTKKPPTTLRPLTTPPFIDISSITPDIKPVDYSTTFKPNDDVTISPDFNLNTTKDLPQLVNITGVFGKGSIETLVTNKDDLVLEEEHMPIVVHRRCANGFTRDKMGHCRRVRKPQAPFSFGISRLATLASKLRQTNETLINDESGDH